MKRLRSRLNRAQRVVASVAIGLIAYGTNQALVHEFRDEGGWFGYAPDTSVTFSPGNAFSRSPWLQLLLWVAFVVAWLVVSVWLFTDDGKAR